MGGDLNLKKSWHPVLMSNQRRVWEEEKKALDERKRTDQRIKELKEERAKEEIQNKLEAAGSRKRIDRVDWMYQGPSSGQAGTTEEMEGYLLGKRRIDGLIKGTEHKKLEKQASEDSFMALQNANTLRDTASKIREDPMLAIKRQEQAAYEAMMNDPIKRRALLATITGEGAKKEKSREKKHRHHHRRRHDESGDEGRHKRRRTDDYEREYSGSRSYHRHRSNSTTPESGPNSPRESRRRSRRESRSISPAMRRRDTSYERASRRDRDVYRRRSRSYSSDSASHNRERRQRPYSEERDQGHQQKNEKPIRRHTTSSHRKDENFSRSNNRKGAPNSQYRHSNSRDTDMKGRDRETTQSSNEDKKAERQRKLAAMQEDASVLDQDRERRLAAIVEKEKADREADEKSRAISSKYGDNAHFVNGLHRKAGDMSLGDRIGRSRQSLQRVD